MEGCGHGPLDFHVLAKEFQTCSVGHRRIERLPLEGEGGFHLEEKVRR